MQLTEPKAAASLQEHRAVLYNKGVGQTQVKTPFQRPLTLRLSSVAGALTPGSHL